MKRNHIAHAIAMTIFVVQAARAEWTEPMPKVPMGMNIQGASYWDRVPYLDPLLTSSEWIAYHDGGSWDDQTASSIALRADGWPVGIPQMVGTVSTKVRTMINNCRGGDYVLAYQGKGAVTWNGGARSRIEDNRTIVTLDGSCEHAWMQVDSSSGSDPIRDMHLVPAQYADAPAKAPLFDPEFVRGLKPFHALRFMDWTQTNGSLQMKWTDRPKPGDRTFGAGKGMPWEHAIALSNQIGADAWICTPHAADDDYLRKLAVLFRDSLRKDLKTYLEYSNEIWNWGFDQAHWVGHNGMDVAWGTEEHSLLAADSLRDSLKRVGLRVCGDTTNYCHPEKDAWMIGRLFRIWEPLWANDRSRLVTVATGQHAWTDNSRRILSWLVDSMKIVPDAFSVAGYVSFETGEGDPIPKSVIPRSSDTVLNSYYHNLWMRKPDTVKAVDVTNAMKTAFPYTSKLWTLETARIVKSFGIKRYLVYEGGQHSQPHNQGDWPYNQAVWDAQIHSGMRDVYLRNFQVHDSIGCDLFMAFSYVGERESKYGSWGHLENYAQSALGLDQLRVAAPKYAALLEANTSRDGSGVLARTKNATRRLEKRTVFDGKVSGLSGDVEICTVSGQTLFRGSAQAAPRMPNGAVVVRRVSPGAVDRN
jgi:hypothetical protein